MAKNTASTRFRNVDVDELDPERFQEDTGDDSASGIPSEGEIQALLNSKKNNDALKLLLNNAPLSASKDSKAKKATFNLVMRVLQQYKSSEMEATVKSLDQQQQHVLLKYVYRGFAEPTDNSCGTLLAFHEKIVACSGIGNIVRVLTDRKQV